MIKPIYRLFADALWFSLMLFSSDALQLKSRGSHHGKNSGMSLLTFPG